MKNEQIMTATQAFNYAMNKYPSLYSTSNIEDSKYIYYDHIFNTIGNGYRSTEEFIEFHKVTEENQHLLNSFPEKYVSIEPLYYAYTKTKKFADFEMGDADSVLPGIYTEKEINEMDCVAKCFVQANAPIVEDEDFDYDERLVPYPNFSKTYSMVWKMDLSKLDDSWKKAALEFYEKAKEFFNGEFSHLYHNAAPKADWKLEETIELYNKGFERYKKEGMSEQDWHKVVSKEYGQEYKGNTKEFIIKGWEIEELRIKKFIDETIEKLNNELNLTTKRKPKI